MRITRLIKNFFLILKYPFLTIYNWDGSPVSFNERFDYTWYDDIPTGWKKAFGKQLLKELRIVCKKEGCLKDFKITEIKEKWYRLRIYTSFYNEKIISILDKYEDLSGHYCISCGRLLDNKYDYSHFGKCNACYIRNA